MKYLSNIRLYLQLEHYYKSCHVRLVVGKAFFIIVHLYLDQSLAATYRGEINFALGWADEVFLG